MSWLIKFIQRGGDLKGAIKYFHTLNGRMPSTPEMNKILQTFGDKGNFKGWTPEVIQGGKSESKIGLGEFTKKEDVYETLYPKIDEAAVDFVRRTEGEEAAQAFKKRLMADNEQQLKLKMEIANKEAAERIRKKKAEEEFFTDERPPKDPEFASGGIARAGFGKGDIVTKGIPFAIKKIKDLFGKNVITTADKIKRPESALTRQLFEDFNKKYSKKPEVLKGDEVLTKQGVSFENKINKQLETTYDDISGGSGFTSGDYKYDAQVLADGIAEDLGFAFDDLPINQQTQLYTAALSRMSKNLQMKRALKKASKPTETLKSIEETGGINISNPKVAEEFTRFMKETDPKGYKKLEQKIQIDTFDTKGKKGHASGGRAGFYFGGDVKPDMSDIGHGSDSLMSRTRVVSPNSMATTSTGLNYLLAEDNDNIRVPYAAGGAFNAARRAFLQAMGGAAAGIAGIKTGLFGFGKATKAAKIAQLKNTTTTMPAWFPDLVNNFMNKGVGKKIDADIMQYKVKELPDVKLEVETSGKVRLEGTNAYKESYQIDYTPPGYEVIDEATGKAAKTKGDFVANDTRYRQTGPEMDDVDVDYDIVNDIEDIVGGDSTKLEGFAKGTNKIKKTKGQKAVDEAEESSAYFQQDRADFNKGPEIDPTDWVDENPDFAKGGRVSLSNGGLAKILGE